MHNAQLQIEIKYLYINIIKYNLHNLFHSIKNYEL